MLAHESDLLYSQSIRFIEWSLCLMFQYAFCCNEEEEVTQISTVIHVDDGNVHIVNIRYVLFSSFQLTL